VCDARTKGQAVELLGEIQVAEDRARNGLDKRPPRDGGGTVDAVVEWWVEKFLSKRASYSQCIGTIRRHIIGSPLGARRLVDATAGQVEAFLEEKSADLSTETLNHLRGYRERPHRGLQQQGKARQEASRRTVEPDDPPTGPKKPPRFRCLPRSGREDSNLRHSAPKNGGRDRKRWQRLASIEKYPRSGWGVVQRFADIGSNFEEFCSYFAPGTGASLERQACGGST
jgi:hypothetical protein